MTDVFNNILDTVGLKQFNKTLKKLYKKKVLFVYNSSNDSYTQVDKINFIKSEVYDYTAMRKITDTEHLEIRFIKYDVIKTLTDRIFVKNKNIIHFSNAVYMNQHNDKWSLAPLFKDDYHFAAYDNNVSITDQIFKAIGKKKKDRQTDIQLLFDLASLG